MRRKTLGSWVKLKGAAATLVTLVSVGRWRLKMMMMWGLMFSERRIENSRLPQGRSSDTLLVT